MDYNKKTKIELIALCKEKGIRGHGRNGITKEQIIQLLKEYKPIDHSSTLDNYDTMKYDDLLRLCKERRITGYGIKNSTGSLKLTKEIMITLLKDNNCRKSLFDYLTNNNPLILTKFVGNIDDLKTVSSGTNKYHTWKCDTSGCLNTFKAIPSNVYKVELPRKYCNICSRTNQKKNIQIAALKRSGSVETVFPFIKDIWSNENKKALNEFPPGSNEKVKLKCPNKSAKHPEYEIVVCKIQEHNQFRCPKCVTRSSNAEMRIYSELKYSFKDVKWQQKIEGREADVTIEDLKLIIEIDGYPWHKDKNEKDLLKNSIFEKNGYSVLRIRDVRLSEILCDTIVCNVTELSLLEFNKIVEWINVKFKYNIQKYDEWKNTAYYKEIQASKLSIKYEDSIEYIFPESKDIWDYEKNHPFIPSQFSQGSHMKIWVKCKYGHSWERILNHLFRIIKYKKYIMRCPECPKQKSNINRMNKNSRIIQINGISYISISEYCRKHNINRRTLYNKLKQNNIDITSITSIQTFIEDNVELLQNISLQ